MQHQHHPRLESQAATRPLNRVNSKVLIELAFNEHLAYIEQVVNTNQSVVFGNELIDPIEIVVRFGSRRYLVHDDRRQCMVISQFNSLDTSS